jgi:chitinase domain-containing protein 1
LSPDEENRHKILVGLNMYGNDYTAVGGDTVVVGAYLKLLEKHKPSFFWDEENEEHYFKYTDSKGDTHTVWYPTLKSIDARLSLLEELGVGASVWEIGQGLDYFVSATLLIVICF